MPSEIYHNGAVVTDLNTLYLKRVLLPFWIIRLILMALFCISYIFAIIAINSGIVDPDASLSGLTAIAATLLVLCVICIIADITCLILFIRHKLKPLLFLIFCSVGALIWIVLFILQAVGAGIASGQGRSVSGFSWLISILTLASFVGLLIYAAVVYHRFRKANPRSAASAMEAQTAYQTPMETHYPGGGPTEYYSPNAQPAYAPVATTDIPVPPQYQDRSSVAKAPAAYDQPIEMSSQPR